MRWDNFAPAKESKRSQPASRVGQHLTTKLSKQWYPICIREQNNRLIMPQQSFRPNWPISCLCRFASANTSWCCCCCCCCCCQCYLGAARCLTFSSHERWMAHHAVGSVAMICYLEASWKSFHPTAPSSTPLANQFPPSASSSHLKSLTSLLSQISI